MTTVNHSLGEHIDDDGNLYRTVEVYWNGIHLTLDFDTARALALALIDELNHFERIKENDSDIVAR
jgi:hypothetical protein